jgi:chromosome segregation ATPase
MEKIYSRVSFGFQIFFIIFIIGLTSFELLFSQTTSSSNEVKNQYSKEISSIKSKVRELSKQIDSLQEELKEIKQTLINNAQEVKETSASVIELNHKIEKVNNDILEVFKKIESILNEISQLKNNDIEFQQRIEGIESSTSTFSKESITGSVKSSLVSEDLENVKKKVDILTKEIKELQSTQNVFGIEDSNFQRIVRSPYIVLTALVISIFALILAF